jgi:hypothetical protein
MAEVPWLAHHSPAVLKDRTGAVAGVDDAAAATVLALGALTIGAYIYATNPEARRSLDTLASKTWGAMTSMAGSGSRAPPTHPNAGTGGISTPLVTPPNGPNGPDEQPRDVLGRFLPKNGQQVPPGINAVTSFENFITQGGEFRIVGREVSFRTPFGLRRYDLVIQNVRTSQTAGIEIKSSEAAMARTGTEANQQFAADRWITSFQRGATSTGQYDIRIDTVYKIQWPPPR